MGQKFHLCILANPGLGNRPLFVGVTPDLARRVAEYRRSERGPLAARLGTTRLVHVETYDAALDALRREEEIRKWPRARQVALVETHNPAWLDLAEHVGGADGIDDVDPLADTEPAPTTSRSPGTTAPSARSPRAA